MYLSGIAPATIPLFLRVLHVPFVSGNVWLPPHPTQTESQVLNSVNLSAQSLMSQCSVGFSSF